MQANILIALLFAAVAVQALPAQLQARGGDWENENGNRGDGYGRGPLVAVWNKQLPTIRYPTEHHYDKDVTRSASRQDRYEQENTRTQTNLHQKVLSKSEYVQDNVHVQKELEVTNVNHHNNHLTVKNVYPKHINTYVNRYKEIIKPQEGRTDSYSNSESREKIVHPTQVENREKNVNLGTEVRPTEWVDVNGGGEGRNRNEGREEAYEK